MLGLLAPQLAHLMEGLHCLTKMHGNPLVHEQNSAPPYTVFYGQDARSAKHL